MTLNRVKVNNAGGVGGVATTNFYFLTVTSVETTALANLYTALKPYYPTAITMQVPNSGDQIDDATGKLVGSWSGGSTSSTVGTGGNTQASPAGIEIAWLAASVIDGHRPVGKTLIVPGAAAAFGSNGQIAPAAITAINTAAANFLAAATSFAIWHRPVYNRKVTPPTLTRPGSALAASSGTCRSLPAVLRSRRQ
jgi:hypothetical protein